MSIQISGVPWYTKLCLRPLGSLSSYLELHGTTNDIPCGTWLFSSCALLTSGLRTTIGSPLYYNGSMYSSIVNDFVCIVCFFSDIFNSCGSTVVLMFVYIELHQKHLHSIYVNSSYISQEGESFKDLLDS